MLQNKFFLITIIIFLLLLCMLLSYILIQNHREKENLLEELSSSQNIIDILQNKIGELLDEVQDLSINYGLLQASETAVSIYSERIVGFSHLNWFIPDYLPLKVNFAISQGFSDTHPAIDFSTSSGQNVYAAATGIIIVGYQDRYLGNMLLIDHLNSYKTLYGHLDRFFVSVNDFVEKGQLIGSVGNTGFSTNPHLHLQVFHQNDPIDPFSVMDIPIVQN